MFTSTMPFYNLIPVARHEQLHQEPQQDLRQHAARPGRTARRSAPPGGDAGLALAVEAGNQLSYTPDARLVPDP
ncbi:MAG: hypothetical protein U1F20_02720 [Lysobacterales bacterium]